MWRRRGTRGQGKMRLCWRASWASLSATPHVCKYLRQVKSPLKHFMKFFFLSSLCCQVGWRILQAVLSSYSTWTPETRDTSSTRRGRPWPACPGPATLSTWWRESLVTGHVSGSGQCQHCPWSQHCRVTSLVWVVSASLEMMIMWWQLEPSTTWPSMCGTGGTTRRSRPTRYHFMSSPSASLTMEHASLLLEIGNYNYYFVKNMILDWHG